MTITIENVDCNPRETGPHRYLLRVNKEDICTFIHSRELSIEDCLLAAIDALPESTKPGMAILFHEVLKDSDDINTLAEVGDLGEVICTFMDGFKVKNHRNDLELFVTRDEFKVIRNVR